MCKCVPVPDCIRFASLTPCSAFYVTQAVSALGIAVGAPMGGLIVEVYGPRAAFLCVSAAATVSMFAYTFLPETVPQSSGAGGV